MEITSADDAELEPGHVSRLEHRRVRCGDAVQRGHGVGEDRLGAAPGVEHLAAALVVEAADPGIDPNHGREGDRVELVAVAVEHVEEPLELTDAPGGSPRRRVDGLDGQRRVEEDCTRARECERRAGRVHGVEELVGEERVLVRIADDEHAVRADRSEADGAHEELREHAALHVQRVRGHLVHVRRVDDVRVRDEGVGHGREQPGCRSGVPGVPSDRRADPRRHDECRRE
jgi:hypothetical protein